LTGGPGIETCRLGARTGSALSPIGRCRGTRFWPRGAIVAADFFTTEVWTVRGLVTYYTAFVIDLESRRVRLVGSTPYPDDAFVC
jgi:hypothetical protein